MMTTSILSYGAILLAVIAEAQSPVPTQRPASFAQSGVPTSSGCFSTIGNMTLHSPPIPASEMSTGSCTKACIAEKFWAAGMHGNECWCGFSYPPANDKTADSKCNFGCPAYPLEACGGSDAYSVWNLGIELQVRNYEPAASSTKTSSAGSTALSTGSDATSGGPSMTQSSAASETSQPHKDGPNVAGIAAGVVVGVVAAAAAIAGFFFYFRRKRNAEIEEEHRRNAAVNAFISGSTPPSSHGSMTMADSRLDPVMAHRRMSDGSIADNEDYSRKILRVTNA